MDSPTFRQRRTADNQVAKPTTKPQERLSTKNNKHHHSYSGFPIQAKMTIGSPNDKYEREADAMAERIMRMPMNSASKTPLSTSSPSIQAKCTECAHEDEKIQRKPLMMKSDGGVKATQALGSQISSSKGNGSPLPSATNSFMSSAFGSDFSQVRVHTGGSAAQMNQGLNAKAFTHGSDIYFNKGQYQPGSSEGKRLLGHELTHVVQQGQRSASPNIQCDYAIDSDRPTGTTVILSAPEKQAALAFNKRLFPRKSDIALMRDVLALKRKPSVVDDDLTNAVMRYQSKYGLPQNGMFDALTSYRLEKEITAEADFLKKPKTGSAMRRVAKTLKFRSRNKAIQKALQKIQRTEATSFASGLGISSQAAMAQEQANFMHAKNQAAAAAAAAGVAPTPQQVTAQQTQSVASSSIAPQTATLSRKDEIAQTKEAKKEVKKFLVWAKSKHPDLKLKKRHIKVDVRAIFNRGQSIIAFSSNKQAVVGKSFTDAAKANPAYVLSTIIHELRGHEQYGPYGQAKSEYGLELYDQAAALMPGYTKPTGQGRTSEIDAFAYQETEIYSLLIEVPYFTPVTKAHSALASVNFDPAPAVSNRIGIIVSQFEPKVAKSLIRGLYMRLRFEPRLSGDSLKVFEAGVRNNFSKTEAAKILKI